MFDPLITAAYAVNAQPGVYAVLLGSGVSRSAHIPTGWEITLDLVTKMAGPEASDPGFDAEAWYRERNGGAAPDYSKVPPAVATTAADQRGVLQSYFEPNAEERDRGEKQPTAAHKAIARLVAMGKVRVIVTTNFDRLMEAALTAENITPVVIASADQAAGASPLAHAPCTVIKVNGDYLDPRLKNSEAALAKYDPKLVKLLTQVFDEYGLIVCGWSAEYDTALRGAIDRIKPRRYQMYWCARGALGAAAQGLVGRHGATVINIDGADTFFDALAEKVQAFHNGRLAHPADASAAVAQLKRYLSEPRLRIRLHDFVTDEAAKAKGQVDTLFEDCRDVKQERAFFGDLLKNIERAMRPLIHIYAAAAMHAEADQANVFRKVFADFATPTPPKNNREDQTYRALRRYPALLLAYASGLASLQERRFAFFAAVFEAPIKVQTEESGLALPAAELCAEKTVYGDEARRLLTGYGDRNTPFSDYLLARLQDLIDGSLRLKIDEDIFDDFEYLWSLMSVDAALQRNAWSDWAPGGAYIWRRSDSFKYDEQAGLVGEARQATEDWPPLRDGLFGRQKSRLDSAVKAADPVFTRRARSYF